MDNKSTDWKKGDTVECTTAVPSRGGNVWLGHSFKLSFVGDGTLKLVGHGDELFDAAYFKKVV